MQSMGQLCRECGWWPPLRRGWWPSLGQCCVVQPRRQPTAEDLTQHTYERGNCTQFKAFNAQTRLTPGQHTSSHTRNPSQAATMLLVWHHTMVLAAPRRQCVPGMQCHDNSQSCRTYAAKVMQDTTAACAASHQPLARTVKCQQCFKMTDRLTQSATPPASATPY